VLRARSLLSVLVLVLGPGCDEAADSGAPAGSTDIDAAASSAPESSPESNPGPLAMPSDGGARSAARPEPAVEPDAVAPLGPVPVAPTESADAGIAAAPVDAPTPPRERDAGGTSLLDASAAVPTDAGGDALGALVPTEAFVVSTGNEAGQDEDPSVLVARDGALYVAFYSNRNGTDADGDIDREIFLARSPAGGADFEAPIQVTDQDGYAFYSSLAQTGDDALHLLWWQMTLVPEGCELSLCGTENRILHNTSADGLTWDPTATVVTEGPGDWLPSAVYDRERDRLLVYFAAVMRGADGEADASEALLRLYVSSYDALGWSRPTRLVGVHGEGMHDSYPFVKQRSDGSFVLVWTRYSGESPSDVLQVISEPTTQVLSAVSNDGVSFSDVTFLSDETPSIDVFPALFEDHSGGWFVNYITAAGDSVRTVEVPFAGPYPDALVDRPEITGYTSRVAKTRTEGLFFAAWVEGAAPNQKVWGRLFER
jgi:hypothetical protein